LTPGQAVRWPFLLLLDTHLREIGWALINGPIVTPDQRDQFVEFRRAGYRFVGTSSYLDFPRGFDDHPLDYEAACEAWCHCFRIPEGFFRTRMPRVLLSISDFTDYHRISPDSVQPTDDVYDFVYVGASEAWKREAKNWPLAARCIPRLCHELGMRALVIGATSDEFESSQFVTYRANLAWHDLLAYLAGAQFLLVPNGRDPSPRVVAESLCLDVPIVVYRQILGGWKYVNRFTGAFFDSEHDVTAAALAVTSGRLSPREWFRAHHGPYLAGRRLLSLIRSIDATIDEQSHLFLSECGVEPAQVTSH